MLRTHPLCAVVLGAVCFISATTIGDEPAASAGDDAFAVFELRNAAEIVSVAVSPDGLGVYTVEYPNGITGRHREVGSTKLHGGVSIGRSKSEELSHIQVSPDGRFVVTTGRGGNVGFYSREGEPGRLKRLDDLTRKSPNCADWRPSKSCFSPDSNFVLVADAAGAVHTFQKNDADKLEPRQVLRDSEGRLTGANSIAVHPDGLTVLVLCPGANALVVLDRNPFDGTLAVRHGFDAGQAPLNDLSGAVDLKLSVDGRFAYVSSGNFRGRYAVSVFQLLSNGKIRLVQEMIDVDGRLRDVQSGYDLALSNDGSRLFVAAKLHDTVMGFDRNLLTGRLSRPHVVYKNPGASPQWPTGLSVSSDGYLFAGTERGGSLLMIRLPGAEVATPPPAPAKRIIRTEPKKVDPKDWPKLAKPAGEKPATATPMPPQPTATKPTEAKPAETKPPVKRPDQRNPDEPKSVAAGATSSADEAEVARITGHRYEVTDVAFSPDGRRAASGGADSKVRIWDVPTAAEIRSIHTTASLEVAWSPDGRILATCGKDNQVVLWDADSGKELRRFRPWPGLSGGIKFSPDGKQLLSTSHGAVHLWDVALGTQVKEFKQEMELVLDVAFSPDGKLAACCGGYFNDSEALLGVVLQVWRLSDGEVLFSHRSKIRSAIRAVAFSADGRLVAAADLDDRGVGVWDWEKGARVKLFDSDAGTLNEVRFSKSGEYLVGGHAGGVMVYAMATGRKLSSFRGNAGSAAAIDLSPDGRSVISANSDETIRIWRLPEPIADKPPTKP